MTKVLLLKKRNRSSIQKRVKHKLHLKIRLPPNSQTLKSLKRGLRHNSHNKAMTSSLKTESHRFSLIAFSRHRDQLPVTPKYSLEVVHLLHSNKSIQSQSADSVTKLSVDHTLVAHQDSQESSRRKAPILPVLLFAFSVRTVQLQLARKREMSLS
jgi:hypothetical protein